eukprot:tig00000158_g10129.t1
MADYAADGDQEMADQVPLVDDEESEINQENAWTVIAAYFEDKGLVRQQLDSFDEFVCNTMQELIDDIQEIQITPVSQHRPGQQTDTKVKYGIQFGQIYLSKPTMTEFDGTVQQMFPNEARLRNLTYAAPLYCDMKKVTYDLDSGDPRQEGSEEKVFLGKIPIMLRSQYCALHQLDQDGLANLGECPYDQGGYFVINGSEKVLIAQEKMSFNHVFVFEKPHGSKYSFTAEILSCQEGVNKPVSKLYVKMLARGTKGLAGQTILASLPYIRQDVPVIVVFRALGFRADRDILEHICYDFHDHQMMELLRPSLEEGFLIQTQEVALDYIGKRGPTTGVSKEKRIQYAKDILIKEMLPHVGISDYCETKKAYFFGYMVHRLLQAALRRRELDDRDHYGNKRLDLAGPLMGGLFRQLLKKLTKEVRITVQKAVDAGKDFTLKLSVKQSTITNGLKYSLATGNWGANKQQARAGVSQVLNRLTFASTLSHLRRLNTPIGREGKLAKPRQLHNTHWGVICPAETPEGGACGLVKNLALMTYITVGSPSAPIIEFLEEWTTENLDEISPSVIPKACKIFVNGYARFKVDLKATKELPRAAEKRDKQLCWIGVHRDPDHLVETLRSLRRCCDVTPEVSIIRDIREQELRLWTDAGRTARPLFIVEKDKGDGMSRLLIKRKHIQALERKESKWEELISGGLVEYIDCEEEETTMIAMMVDDVTKCARVS